MLPVDRLRVVRFTRDDPGSMKELQALLERCSDDYELHVRRASASECCDEFDHVPPEIPRENLFILGFRHGGDLIAEMSLVLPPPKPTGARRRVVIMRRPMP